MTHSALKELLYKMADDQLIVGHRNSEWTGLGPILEEDIAFSSMAQDKIGQAQALYTLLHRLGESDPDQLGFKRKAEEFKCCHVTEYPIGEYDFSLVRHFLFDHAEYIRFTLLCESKYEPLSQVARKFRGEIKYHIFHANTWIKQLGQANSESNGRLQHSLQLCFPLALGIFEKSPFEKTISEEGIFSGEEILQQMWFDTISPLLSEAGLSIPSGTAPSYGGRLGKHTEYLQPLLLEMTEVFSIDSQANW